MEFNVLLNRIITVANIKIEEILRKKAEQNRLHLEQQRKQIENVKNVSLCKRWADALNSLPDHMRVAKNDIDSYVLTNNLLENYWELKIPYPDVLNRSKKNKFIEQLSKILDNQYRECYQLFEQRIYSDSNEYAEQMRIIENNGKRTKDDAIFGANYTQFFNAYSCTLIGVEIIEIECVENALLIQYIIVENSYNYFHYNNYWNLISK